MVKVLMICDPYPNDVKPIVQVYLKEHVEMAKRIAEVRLLALNRFHFLLDNFVRFKYKGEKIEVYFTQFDKFLSYILYYVISIMLYLLYFRKFSPHLLHAHDVFPAGFLAYLLAKIFKKKYIITVHSTHLITDKINPLKRFLFRRIFENAKKVIFVSNYCKKEIGKRLNLSCFNCISIPNPVGLVSIPHHESNNVIFVGSITRRKGVHNLVEAFASLDTEDNLILIGDGDMREEIEKKIHDKGIKNVVMKGALQPYEVFKEMACSKFLILPSEIETFGKVLIEAMSLGKPVIATKCGGPEEIVKPFCGILIPKGDVKALKEAIEYMLKNYRKYDSEKIKKYVEENFSIEAVAKKLKEVYYEA